MGPLNGLLLSYAQDKKVHERASERPSLSTLSPLGAEAEDPWPPRALGWIVRGKNMPKMDCACDDSVITQDFMSLKKKVACSNFKSNFAPQQLKGQ